MLSPAPGKIDWLVRGALVQAGLHLGLDVFNRVIQTTRVADLKLLSGRPENVVRKGA